MLEKFIKKYTKNITKDDIINFAYKQNIELKNYEVNIIYDEIHNNINNLINNTDNELSKIKDKLEYTTYLKIIELISLYKEKYNNYL